MKRSILTCIIILAATVAFAQQATTTITGIVHDSTSRKPIPNVTVRLNDTAAKLIAAAITDDKGIFRLDGVPSGNFTLTASFIGFQPVVKSTTVNSARINMGTIMLRADALLLQEATVTADRSSVSLKLDKKIFQAGKDIISQAGSVTDLLNVVPSVAVAPGGGISLRGNSNVLVLINGRRSGLTAANALEQVPADQVERVEVITNPSSRYDAAGSAGIINIVLKKNKKAGFNGQMRLVAGSPNETRITPSLNYKSNKLNLFSTFGIRLSDYKGLYTTDQITDPGNTPVYLARRENEKRHDDAKLFYIGADYRVNDHNSLTAAFLKNATHDHDKSTLNYLYSGAATDSILSRRAESWEKRSYNQFEFNYTRIFSKPGKKFTVDMQYDYWNSDKDWNLATQKDYPVTIALPAIRTGSVGASKDLMIQTDFVQPVDSNSTFEFGLKAESRRVSTDFIAEEEKTTGWKIIEDIDNRLLYKEMISSGYVQFGSRIKKFGYQLGLRNELTHIVIEDRAGSYNNSKNYNRLFPTLNLSYRFNAATTLQSSYSKRINRPSLDLIYPFNELTDLNARFIGNPELNPSYANVFETGLLFNKKKLTINPSVYYQNTSGIIKEYTFQNNGGVFITTPININRETRQGAEISILYNPKKWLQINSELNVYGFKQSGFYKDQNFDYTGSTLTGRVSTQIRLQKKLGFQMLYNFRGANATVQTRSATVHAIDFGASKGLLKDKATLLFDVNNLFFRCANLKALQRAMIM
jgi:outer membrane receptor protein involved in Fe transport